MGATEEHHAVSAIRQNTVKSRARRGLELPSADTGCRWKLARTPNPLERLLMAERQSLKIVPGTGDMPDLKITQPGPVSATGREQ